MITYRPDIDGLRAVAIVPVVLFHAFPDALPGGFIGVDIFFVISGYLITRIILADLDHGRFSLAGFWGRRCRRILPALLFMLMVVTGAGLVLLLPEDLKQYGAMLAATALFFANMQLAQDNGYFAPEFHDNPLLHTWSLSVEEQYYLLWPMLLLALSRAVRRKYLPLCILAMIAASLAHSQWAVLNSPEQAFFGLPSRAFELLIGAGLAAVGPAFQPSRVLANTLAWTGAALIAAGFTLLSRVTPFPGIAALVPCLGAACLIAAGNSGSAATLVGHALSSRAFVDIGKVSYSWYLWHWPPLAFAHYYFSRPLGFGETLALIGVGFIAAVFSWYFVETPFRDHRAGLAFRRRAAPTLAVCMVAFLLLGGALFFADGIISRLSPEAQAIRIAFLQEEVDDGSRARPSERGTFGAMGDVQPSLLVWGDSHASHYMSAIADIAAAHGLKGIQLLIRHSNRVPSDCKSVHASHVEGP